MSVDEICENTKMGREFAILGNYETSMVYYQGVLQQIQKLLTTTHEPEQKHLWQTVSTVYMVIGSFNTQCTYSNCVINTVILQIQLLQ